MSSATAPPRRLTSLNDEVMASLELGNIERFTWTSDGFNEDGIVVYPPDFQPDRKYPLVLYIHGGPQAASTRTFSMLAATLRRARLVVFSPNYRGSDNLGNAYQRAIFNDAGAGPGRDVNGRPRRAGEARLHRSRPHRRFRAGRTAVTWTSWLIGHSNIWKAAVSGAGGVNNLAHEYALSDNNIHLRLFSRLDRPYDPKFAKAYTEQSPIT